MTSLLKPWAAAAASLAIAACIAPLGARAALADSPDARAAIAAAAVGDGDTDLRPSQPDPSGPRGGPPASRPQAAASPPGQGGATRAAHEPVTLLLAGLALMMAAVRIGPPATQDRRNDPPER